MNKNHFQANNEADENYQIIYWTMICMAFFTIPMFLLLSSLAMHMNAKLYEIIKNFKVNFNYRYVLCQTPRLSLLFTNITVNIAVVIFHIFSAIREVEYCNEMFHGNYTDYDDRAYDTVYISAAIVAILALIIPVFAVMVLYEGIKSCVTNTLTKGFRSCVTRLAIMSILLNIIYLGCIFMPYMILAFIINPFQTTLMYLVLTCIIGVIYILFFSLTSVGLLFAPAVGLSLSAVFFLIMINFILTLGSFTEFQELENLVFALIIGLFTTLAWKPTKLYLHELHSKSQSREEANNLITSDDHDQVNTSATSFMIHEITV